MCKKAVIPFILYVNTITTSKHTDQSQIKDPPLKTAAK